MAIPLSGNRFLKRLVYHYSIIIIVTLLCSLVLNHFIKSPDRMFSWSMITAYTSLLFLSASLFTGPINVLLNRSNPLTTDLRRDIGIWGAILAISHTIIGLQRHFIGKMHLYFLQEVGQDNHLTVRFGNFGIANHSGLIAIIAIIIILILSNDISIRKLQAAKWKSVQRLNYFAFILVLLHGLLYQLIGSRTSPFIIMFGSIAILTIIIQVSGYIKLKQRQRS